MPSILFVCIANSFRSQMAEGFGRSIGGRAWEVWSAGSHPSGQVHAFATRLMAERGIDLSGHRSKGLADVPDHEWDYVVTMGCGEACPTARGRHQIDWGIPDPAGLLPEEARKVRDDLERRIRELMSRDPATQGGNER